MLRLSQKKRYIVFGIIAAVLAAVIAVSVILTVMLKYKHSNNGSFISSAYDSIEYVYLDDVDTSSESAPKDNSASDDETIPPQQPEKVEIPVYDTPLFTAKEVGSLFDVAHYMGYTQTSNKTYVYGESTVKDFNEFVLPPMYQSDYIDINTRENIELNEAELKTFADEMVNKTKNMVSAHIDTGNIERNSSIEWLEINQDIDEDTRVEFTQTENFHFYSFSFYPQNTDKVFSVDGVPFNVCQTQSEDEIVMSLEGIKQILFDTFGVRLDKVKVDKDMDSTMENVSTIEVKYYESKSKENITLRFYNSIGMYNGKAYINQVYVSYWRPRGTSVLAARAKMLPLAEAEEYLKKGYVFAGYMCPDCDTDRIAVDFSEYDYVGIHAIYHKERKLEIPFYVFYKYIGTSPVTGKKTYGITYVPATPVSGLDEYFANFRVGHPPFPWGESGAS